jgi:hypothetical protein
MQPELKVTVFWGDILYDTTLCPRDSRVTVGKSPEDTFLLDLPGSKLRSLELVKVSRQNEAVLQFDDSIDGHVRFGEELLTLHALKASKRAKRDRNGLYQVKLSAADRADLVIGHVSFYLDWAKGRTRIPSAPFISLQNAMLAFLFLGVLGVVLWNLPRGLARIESERPPERLVSLVERKIVAPKVIPTPRPVVPVVPTKAALGNRKAKQGGAEKHTRGKAKLSRPIVREVKRKAQARVVVGAVRHPVAAADTSAAEGAWTGKLGNVAKGLSSIDAGGAPAVEAPREGEAAPVDQVAESEGFSTEGIKTGGGGRSVGIGRTVGQGEGGFEGTGKLGIAGNSATEKGSGRGPSSTVVDGGLDREVIDSIIRRRQDRIRLCYERQLNFNPHLSGKITVAFVIGKRGEVMKSDIAEDTMKNEAVASCVIREVKSWSFPAPRGGTLVKVDYPFVFESSGR